MVGRSVLSGEVMGEIFGRKAINLFPAKNLSSIHKLKSGSK
jgi:hypothetical protein